MAGIRDNPINKANTTEQSSRDKAIENLVKKAESVRSTQSEAIQRAKEDAARKAAQIDKFREELSVMSAEEKAQLLRTFMNKDEK